MLKPKAIVLWLIFKAYQILSILKYQNNALDDITTQYVAALTYYGVIIEYTKDDFRNKNLRRLSLGTQTKLCYNTAIICRITIGMVVINIIMIAVVII